MEWFGWVAIIIALVGLPLFVWTLRRDSRNWRPEDDYRGGY